MPLAAGQSLSFYEILGPLGAGGMGEVYRARDTRLDREVAIKVLPEDFADDPDRLRRFEREAKILASLNHPHVAGIHGVDQDGDTYFLSLELVPGSDLSTRLAKGPLPMGEALDVCRQIAEGLEAAHECGVVHRDLKPANVRITPEGVVKILDFGLAKPVHTRMTTGGASGAEPDSILTTEEGVLMGTPTYMSPEQARGKPVDRRTDIWAFGCVLYECLTGARAFGGAGVPDILAAVLERGWDRSRLPTVTPDHVRELLERCLDKDARQRLRDIGEARILLERGPAASPETLGKRQPQALPFVVGGLILVALGIGAFAGKFWGEPPPGPEPRVIRQLRLTEDVGMEEMPAISPDGNLVAYISRVNGWRQVFVRLVDEGSGDQITQGDFDHSFPRWADENTLIYYRKLTEEDESGAIWERGNRRSSSPQLIVEPAQGEADVNHARDTIAIFRTDDEGPALVLIERGGNKTEDVRRLPAGVTYFSPRWSPDDTKIAYQARIHLSRTEIRILDLDTDVSRPVITRSQTRGIAWLPDGSGLVYASSVGTTLPYPPVFSLRIVSADGSSDTPLPYGDSSYTSYVEPDVTQVGKLVASRIRTESDIFKYPVEGSPLENVANAKRITNQTGMVQVPSVSPDGEDVAYLSDRGGHANVWVARVDGTEGPRRITHARDPLEVIGLPVWSPRRESSHDEWIVYYKGNAGNDEYAEEWLVRPDGSGDRFLVRTLGAAVWSHDGEWVYHIAPEDSPSVSTNKIRIRDGKLVPVRPRAIGLSVTADGSTGFFCTDDDLSGEIWRVSPVDTGEPELLIKVSPSRIPVWPHVHALSPNDEWLAMPLRDRGTTNLWLFSTADGSPKQITDFQQDATTIGRQVSWSSDSRYIFAALMETDADIVLLEGAVE